MEKINEINLGDIAYPPLLSQLKDRPKKLYARGTTNILRQQPIVAIVGTRKMTTYGQAIIKRLVPILIRHNITTVSGLALGTDALVHEETLNANGQTIAVLGSGIDDLNISPRTNLRLAKRLLSERGAIVSEYPPGTPAEPFRFPERNRIVAGLAQAVIVTEGTMKSGTLITARWALEYGRELFAVPGPITTETSSAPNWLIAQGAPPLLRAEDLLERLGINPQKTEVKNSTLLSQNASLILSKLQSAPKTPDDLIETLDLDIEAILTAISELEINELIFKSGNSYLIKSTS
jgi:DNA processing protein